MRKKLPSDEYVTRAKRREIKKRPRMKMHGAALRKPGKHAAGAILAVR
jgi:hypothetical protein